MKNPDANGGVLAAIRQLFAMQSPCRLCPRACGARRAAGQAGVCGATNELLLASATVHRGEEPPISGSRGSGTLFFSHCALGCRFCQNWPISQGGVGKALTVYELAERMLELERRGVHNINLVNPTHYWPQIALAVFWARARGLRVPVLANSSGFERVEVLALLDETVQIWMPDVKYDDPKLARRLSGSDRLPGASWSALRFLVKRHGPLRLGADGMACAGVMVRHLVLPTRLHETRRVLRGFRRRVGRQVPLSLLTQYFPAYKANEDPRLNRPLHWAEIRRAHALLRRARLKHGWRQENDGRHQTDDRSTP